jgi:hypothetical protein
MFNITKSIDQFNRTINSEREVLLVGLIALLIYLPGIFWGLPYATHALGVHSWETDAVTGMQALSELHNLFIEPKPDWYLAYPTFHYLLIGALYTPYLGFLFLTGQFTQPGPVYPFGFSDPVSAIRNLIIIAKILTVLMASGIVINAYLTARVIWDKQTARITALAVALPTTMIFYSRTGNLEVPVLFWMSLTILTVALSITKGLTIKRAIWIGIFAGVSVATKDSAYGSLSIALISLLFIHFWYGTPNTENTSSWKAPLALVLTGLFVFLLAGGFFISPSRFFGHISFIRNFDKTFYLVIQLDNLYPQTLSGYWNLFLEIVEDMIKSLGPLFLITGIAGLIISWRASVFVKILSLMFLAHIILVIFQVRHMQYRYIMVPAFIFAFFIAPALITGLRNSRKSVVAFTTLIMILGFGWLSLRAVDLTYQMHYDSRYEAGEWIKENANATSKIAFFTDPNSLPHLEKGIIPVSLIRDPSPIKTLQEQQIEFVLVQSDWSSKIGSDRSHFFPERVYKKITDGSIGYEKAASFETAPLFKWFLLDLPLVTPGYIVNPPLKIYQLKTDENTSKREKE